MLFIPSDSVEKLEFDKIRQLVALEAYGQPAVDRIYGIVPSSDFKKIMTQLHQSDECKASIVTNDKVPMTAYEDISACLQPLHIVDYVLDIEDILRIRNLYLLGYDILKYFDGSRKIAYPHFSQLVENVDNDDSILIYFNKIFTPDGQIRNDASETLVSIRKKMATRQAVLEKQFRFLLNSYKSKEYLAESSESIRNGRKVLCVLAEHKRKIRGIIHDESATGKTAYIEPEEIIEINNDIFDLEQEERREIYRILKALCAFLSDKTALLQNYQELITEIDIINAKARFALKYNGNKPRLLNKPYLSIIEGYHTLLYLKNKELGKPTIPFTLQLKNDNRIVIISGPNAGGKSITLKAVGLLQLMVQSGMLIPVDKNSEFGIFQSLFTDIGDQQSIEDDLSTYSSRLRFIKEFLDVADENSLAIIDEFGSGTDPKIGGAIAEAALSEINKQKSFGVITTHYSNLKLFAYKTKGIINASMHFDKERLKPSFELLVGKPGSSYAYEIAQKTGFTKELLDYALHKTGKNEKAIDEILADLQAELKVLQDKISEVKEREIFVDKLIKNYNDLQKDLEFRRKKFKLEHKESNLQKIAHDSKQVEKVLREIKGMQNVKKAEILATELKEAKKSLEKDILILEQELVKEIPLTALKKKIEEGDYVRIKTGGAIGKLLSLGKEKALVEMGGMTLTVKAKDLVSADVPIEQNRRPGVTTTLRSDQEPESKVDLRGMRKEEAVKVLESFIDNALIHNAHMLRILHGKGDGVLKKLVWTKLKEYKDVREVQHPEEEFGGSGVTIVKL